MVIIKEPFKTLLGILSAAFALYMGRMFWIYCLFSFGTLLSILVIPTMLGYVYIAINLARFKKWAWTIFVLIVLSAVFFETLFIFIGGSKVSLLEELSAMISLSSMIVIPVFGISALIRKLVGK